MATLCGFSIQLCSTVEPSLIEKGASAVGVGDGLGDGHSSRTGGAWHSLSFPLLSGAHVLAKHHSLNDGNNKNKPFLWLLCCQRFPYCGLFLSMEKNSSPHVFYPIRAKKTIFKRQKRRYGREGIVVGPAATSGNRHHCSKSFKQRIGRGEWLEGSCRTQMKTNPKEWCQLLKDMVQKGQATRPGAQVERGKGAGAARNPNGLRRGHRLEGGEGYCRGDSGHYVVRVKEVVRLWGELWCRQKKSQELKRPVIAQRETQQGTWEASEQPSQTSSGSQCDLLPSL